MKKKVFIITGHTRCGKDTVGEYLVDRLIAKGLRAKRMALATPLKDATATILGVTPDVLDDMKNKDSLVVVGSKMATARDVIKNVGAAIRDHIGHTVFIDKVKQTITDDFLFDEYNCIVITDMRKLIEFNKLRAMNNYFTEVYTVKLKSNISTCHEDEFDVDVNNMECDFIINNVQDTERYKLDIDAMIKSCIQN